MICLAGGVRFFQQRVVLCSMLLLQRLDFLCERGNFTLRLNRISKEAAGGLANIGASAVRELLREPHGFIKRTLLPDDDALCIARVGPGVIGRFVEGLRKIALLLEPGFRVCLLRGQFCDGCHRSLDFGPLRHDFLKGVSCSRKLAEASCGILGGFLAILAGLLERTQSFFLRGQRFKLCTVGFQLVGGLLGGCLL